MRRKTRTLLPALRTAQPDRLALAPTFCRLDSPPVGHLDAKDAHPARVAFSVLARLGQARDQLLAEGRVRRRTALHQLIKASRHRHLLSPLPSPRRRSLDRSGLADSAVRANSSPSAS